jgi:hypothetical protein
MMGLTLWAGVELASPGVTRAGDWPGRRGPTGCGTTEEKDLVLKWDGKTGEGVLWKAPLKCAAGQPTPSIRVSPDGKDAGGVNVAIRHNAKEILNSCVRPVHQRY